MQLKQNGLYLPFNGSIGTRNSQGSFASGAQIFEASVSLEDAAQNREASYIEHKNMLKASIEHLRTLDSNEANDQNNENTEIRS